MDFLNKIHSKIYIITIVILITLLGGSLAFGFYKPGAFGPSDSEAANTKNLSKAILEVKGTTCISCVEDIKAALSSVKGVGPVTVDTSLGQAQVYFDEKKIEDPEVISRTITDSGYPSSIINIFSAKQVKQQENMYSKKAEKYVAAVGDYEISRDDFIIECNSYKKRYKQAYGEEVFSGDQGSSLEKSIEKRVFTRLIDEALIMGEAKKAGFTVSEKEIENDFALFTASLTKTDETYAEFLENSGYEESYFVSKFNNYTLIQRYIDTVIAKDSKNQNDKQAVYGAWYQEIRPRVPVVYYDKTLENLVTTSQSGGSCCN